MTSYPLVEDTWTDVLRRTLHESYADAGDEELEEALAGMLDTMSPAESFNFSQALNQIGRSTGRVLSDPTVASISRQALPVAGGALGTVIGGPAGTAIGGQLGTRAAAALPASARPSPTGVPPAFGRAAGSPVAGGSDAALQALVLSQQPQLLQSLLAAALGGHGQPQVAGVPVAKMLGMFSEVIGQAAADADELLYLEQGDPDAESGGEPVEPARSLYTALLDADNLELAEAFDDREEDFA
ncbi:hypothetical protein [Streptomyces sp. SID13031]|uniref:hypothetical protein n=1 Tax=Streptomyces sp. SID13031 TaxID=2706046 RepID=UPI0013C9DF7E|nr:hypothetical protein [Streptomyces sp. SID13031]NEA33395.1 hypothetical protein [Streptomyces sp. SID13031]